MQLSRTHRILAASLPLAAGLLLPLGAQSSDKAVEADIDFARGLARDWAFVDMAQSVLDEVSGAKLSDRMAEELELVRCDIFGIGAKASTDPTTRNGLFEQAIEAYESYVETNPFADNRADAEKSLIDLASVYARSIDISLEDAVGDEAKELRTAKVAVLEKAVKRSESLIEELLAVPEPTPEQTTQRYILMLDKASLYGKMSASTPDDTYFSEEAIETYSDLIFDVGEGTEIALRANAGIGDVMLAQGQDEDAREFYLGVIDKVIPVDETEREEALDWSKLPLDIKQKRFLYVELSIPGVQKTSRNLGELDAAISSGLFFYNLYRSEGFSLSVLGNDAMLEFASTLVDAGGFIGGNLGAGNAQWFATEAEMREEFRARRLQRTSLEFALELAKRVVDDNPGSEVARKGGVLIGSINERPGVEIPIAQLLQAADAKRAGEDYDAAMSGYYEALQRVDALAAADRAEFGAKTCYSMGLTLKRQGRNLQAAMSFREGLVNWRDPEFDRNNARGYQATIKSWARDAGATRDAEVEAMIREAENFVIQFDKEGSPGEIMFNRGEKARSRGDFEGAIAEYEQIAEDDGFYELARIQTGLCKLQLLVAENKYKKSDGADTSGYPRVIEGLKDYATTHGDAGKLVVRAQKMLATSYAKLGDAQHAAEIVAEMIRDYPDNKETASSAIDLYTALKKRRKLLAAEPEPDAEAIQGVTLDMANALKVANGAVASPEFTNLRTEGNLWEELQMWAEAKRPFERIVTRFRDDEQYGKAVIDHVIPDLADAMVRLGEVAEAKDLLSPLVVGDDAPLRSRRPTMILGRAMLGDIVSDGTRVTRTPGAGGTDEEFAFLTKRFDTFTKSDEGWTCLWYEAKFMSIYAYYVWGQSNDLKLATAKNVLDDMLGFLENDLQFSAVDTSCTEDETDEDARKRLGSGALSARYRWLYERTH